MRYRKKPVVIEAVQFTGQNPHTVLNFTGKQHVSIDGEKLIVHTLEGPLTAQPGDFIIRGVKGELYPCKPDIFEATYEAAE